MSSRARNWFGGLLCLACLGTLLFINETDRGPIELDWRARFTSLFRSRSAARAHAGPQETRSRRRPGRAPGGRGAGDNVERAIKERIALIDSDLQSLKLKIDDPKVGYAVLDSSPHRASAPPADKESVGLVAATSLSRQWPFPSERSAWLPSARNSLAFRHVQQGLGHPGVRSV